MNILQKLRGRNYRLREELISTPSPIDSSHLTKRIRNTILWLYQIEASATSYITTCSPTYVYDEMQLATVMIALQ